MGAVVDQIGHDHGIEAFDQHGRDDVGITMHRRQDADALALQHQVICRQRLGHDQPVGDAAGHHALPARKHRIAGPADVGGDIGMGIDLGIRPTVQQEFRAQIVVGMGVGDEDRFQIPARGLDPGHQRFGLGADELGIDHQCLPLAKDQRAVHDAALLAGGEDLGSGNGGMGGSGPKAHRGRQRQHGPAPDHISSLHRETP